MRPYSRPVQLSIGTHERLTSLRGRLGKTMERDFTLAETIGYALQVTEDSLSGKQWISLPSMQRRIADLCMRVSERANRPLVGVSFNQALGLVTLHPLEGQPETVDLEADPVQAAKN